MNGPAVKVENLTKQFGSRKAVDGVSFTLPQGAFLTVFGPNGAGKTTLLRMLATLARPSAGTVEVAGFPDKQSACLSWRTKRCTTRFCVWNREQDRRQSRILQPVRRIVFPWNFSGASLCHGNRPDHLLQTDIRRL